MNKELRSLYSNPVKGFLYLLPGLIVYLVFFTIPVFRSLFSSFFEYETMFTRNFAGVSNYTAVIKDIAFWQALIHNGVLIIFLMILPGIIGLILATLFEVAKPRFGKVFEVSFFAPQILSMVVVGVIWKWIYNPIFGILNSFFRAVGLDFLAKPWLGDFSTALFAVGFTGTWVNYGFAMIIFIAGYKRISPSLFESASLDGAGFWKKFQYISIPSLKKEIAVVFTYLYIQSLKTFDLVYVMTKGGPGTSTSVISHYVFKNAFQYNRLGYAATLAIYLLVFIIAGSMLISWLTERDKDE